MVSPSPGAADVIVIGDGLIGLSTAFELGRAGARTVVLAAQRDGAATPASAGLLIPTVGDLPDAVRPFFLDSLARYPAFVERLRAYDQTLAILEGVVERGPTGDVLHPRDGAIDNVRLLAALRAAIADQSTISLVRQAAVELRPGGSHVDVHLDDGRAVTGARAVVAAGAWAAQIRGLPRPLPVRPLKGQMIAVHTSPQRPSPLTRAMMGENVYLVPRGTETLVGATVEEAGFDTTVTNEAVEYLHTEAVALCPELRGATVARSWAGVRPATPDMLPILGADPDHETVVYACGHSKNGILLAPGTAAALANLCTHNSASSLITSFSIVRFGNL